MTARDNWLADEPEPMDPAVMEGAIDTVVQTYIDDGRLAELFSALVNAAPAIRHTLKSITFSQPLAYDFAELARQVESLESAVNEECVSQSTYQEKDDE